jgi:hypothetical protein
LVATPSYSIPGAIAYQLVFSSFDLDNATASNPDVLYVQDSQGRLGGALTGDGVAATPASSWSSGLSGMSSPWIFDSGVTLRMTTNGANSGANKGYQIASINYIMDTPQAPVPHYPTIYVMNLASWNSAGHPASFSAAATADGVLVRISKTCSGTGGAGTVCVDSGSSPDLKYMTCPVSNEISVYQAGTNTTLYWGDECGQLFTAAYDPVADRWSARRLLSLTNANVSSQQTSVGNSKDFRKIFRRIDIVPSSCPGQRVTGLYFGTGNEQRPRATDELTDTNLVASGRDVVGVFWDDGVVRNKTIANLQDLTNTVSMDPKVMFASGKSGWFFNLGPNERMLRDPLVFTGTAYFKTFTPGVSNQAMCVLGNGTEAIYSVNNCTAAPANPSSANGGAGTTADRRTWSNAGDIGGGLVVYTPRVGPDVISHGDISSAQKANLAKPMSRVPRIFNWRIPRGF